MQKIGLNKAKKDNLICFKKLMDNKTINIKDIKDISSIIINVNNIELAYIANLNKIRINFVLYLDIIYLSHEGNNLYAFKDDFNCFDFIDIPKTIGKDAFRKQNFINKIQKEIFIENINAKINGNWITLSYFIIINIKTPSTYSIAYVIDNGFGDNIYLSFNNGKSLSQKTFLQDSFINNIQWDNINSELWFICTNFNITNMYYLNKDYKNINVRKNINSSLNINNFKNISDFKLSLSDSLLKNIYSMDNIYFSKKNKSIYYILNNDNIRYLYALDHDSTDEVLFNYGQVINYYVSYMEDFLIVKTLKNNEICLFEIEISSKLINKIFIDEDISNIEDIIDIKYIYNSDNLHQILILTKNNCVENMLSTLYLYNPKECSLEILFQNNITTFDIDYETLDLYFVIKNRNLSSVEKINLNELKKSKHLDTILKVAGNIKLINIKKA